MSVSPLHCSECGSHVASTANGKCQQCYHEDSAIRMMRDGLALFEKTVAERRRLMKNRLKSLR